MDGYLRGTGIVCKCNVMVAIPKRHVFHIVFRCNLLSVYTVASDYECRFGICNSGDSATANHVAIVIAESEPEYLVYIIGSECYALLDALSAVESQRNGIYWS